MEPYWMKGLLAAAGLFTLGLGVWGFSERSDRRRAEGSGVLLQERLEAQGQALEQATREGRETATRLARTQTDLRGLEQRYREDALAQRQAADRMLVEKAALLEQGKLLELQLKGQNEKIGGLNVNLEKALEEHQQLETVLTGERGDAKTLSKALRLEIDAARAAAKQNAESAQKSRESSQTLQRELQRTAATVQATESENNKLARDLQRTTADRDAAAWSVQQTQQALNQALNLLRSRDVELRALRDQLIRMQQELDRHHQTMHQQERTIQALNAELAKLKKPGP